MANRVQRFDTTQSCFSKAGVSAGVKLDRAASPVGWTWHILCWWRSANIWAVAPSATITHRQQKTAEFGAGFQQMDGECVAERLRCDRLSKPGEPPCFLKRPVLRRATQ